MNERSFRPLIFFSLAVVLPVVVFALFLPGASHDVFSTGQFMPHSHCYLNQGKVIWLHVTSDFLIGAAYVAISSMLAFLVYKARHDIPFSWMFLAFGIFIISCGATHFMEVVTVWHPLYWLSGDLKAITAVASVATAAAFPMLLPRIFTLIQTAKAAEEHQAKLQIAHGEMAALNRQLRELDELKSQFFANLSHELRTPLSLILGPLQNQLERTELTPENRRELELAKRHALVMLKHVNDLLDASKLDAGRMGLNYEAADLASLTRLVASNFEVVARERGIQFSLSLPSVLPAEVDGEKWERILTNLFSNAFKFAPDRGQIRCALAADSGQAVLTVADNGPGVRPEYRELIFERFRQVEGGTTRRFGGTGLGLAITREFVALHHGSIGVEDAPDGGALFTVRIPLKAPAGVPVKTAPEVTEPAAAVQAVEQLRAETLPASTPVQISPEETEKPLVLVVEDNLEMQHFLHNLLAADYRTALAANGRQALALAEELRPDLILTDIMMPEMSGDQLLRKLRSEPSFNSVPIVLLTAKADDALRTQLLREGAQDYILKPFSVEEVLARIGNLITARKTQLALHRTNLELEAFSYSLSHDMRAPLRAMQSFAQILLEEAGEKLDAAQMQYLKRIMAAGERLDRLIQDILSYSRLARAALPLHPVDLEPLIRQVIEEQPAFQAPRAHIEIASPLLAVRGHEASLTQCISNLLSNAVKFVPPDREPRVIIRTEPRNGRVRIWFEDNGIGMEERDLERVFRMFERVHSPRAYAGTGIGLAIVRKAAERMGGKAGAESTPGEGSRFWIELPRQMS